MANTSELISDISQAQAGAPAQSNLESLSCTNLFLTISAILSARYSVQITVKEAT
jgi:hypothetical protein